MKKLILLSTFIIFFLTTQNIFACVCVGRDSVCQAYDSAELIVTGKVGKADNLTSIPFQVDETFKGKLLKEIIISDEATSCSQYFKEGEQWLLYAYFDKKTKTWIAPQCGRSTRIYSIPSDLYYLKNVRERQGKTFLSGKIMNVEYLEGLKVKLVGKTQTFETTTDKLGYYELSDFPADFYKITPEIPQKLIFDNYYLSGFNTIYLDMLLSSEKYVLNNFKEQRCVGVDFSYNKKL